MAIPKYYFQPKEDITTFELALVVAFTQHGQGSLAMDGMYVMDFDEIPETVRRHFTMQKPERKAA